MNFFTQLADYLRFSLKKWRLGLLVSSCQKSLPKQHLFYGDFEQCSLTTWGAKHFQAPLL